MTAVPLSTASARSSRRMEQPRPTLLLASDLGDASAPAADYAVAMAARLGARLLIVNVIDPATALLPGARVDQVRGVRERAAQGVVSLARAAGVDAMFLIWTGEAGQGVVEAAEAEGADLIVVGSHQRDRLRRVLLGSVSDHVVRHAHCPVLIVPPAGQPD